MKVAQIFAKLIKHNYDRALVSNAVNKMCIIYV